jgi:serine/threonine-protein kinase
MRAALAYRRSRALRAEPLRASPFIDSALTWTDRVLAAEPRNAGALELRGQLKLQRFMLHLIPDPAEAERILPEVESDLRKAVDINPAQAGAWATLSSYYYRIPNVPQANSAAREAYKADAFLTNAEEILQRLFWTSHDMDAFPDAQQWCTEGRRRFPRNPFFVECQLWMLTTKAKAPDVAEAWRLVDSLQRVTPERNWPTEGRTGQILAAAVLVRAGLPDSARSTLMRARANADIDPRRELAGYEAIVRVMLHDYDEAVRLIESYVALNPEHLRGFAKITGPWWRDPALQNHPRFKALIAGAR